MRPLLIKNGLAVDPSGEARRDLLLEGGKVTLLSPKIEPPPGCEVFDAAGMWVFPGFVDLHVHAREPGGEAAETMATAAASAAAGGVTSILLMPNTSPAMDSPALLKKYSAKAARCPVNVYLSAAATRGRAGRAPAPLAALKRAGARAFTDDGTSINPSLLPGLIRTAAALGLPLMDHPEDFSVTGPGVAAPGAARRLGLAPIPPEAEEFAVLRGLLAAAANGPLHLQHLSLASSAGLLRRAKALGWPVTAETCPHYFALCDRDIKRDDANFKMKPPLRAAADRAALLRAIADGTIDAIATDHAPHEARLKKAGFAAAPFGIIGLETLAPLCVTRLVLARRISRVRLAQLLSGNPARILGLAGKGSLNPGSDADITVIDPRRLRRVPSGFVSKSANSPFIGLPLRGWPALTVVGGRIVFRAGGTV